MTPITLQGLCRVCPNKVFRRHSGVVPISFGGYLGVVPETF